MADNDFYYPGYQPGGQPGGQRPQRSPQGQGGKKKKKKDTASISATVKGIIAVMVTFLIVTIVIMVFAKSLFMGGSDEPAKTGVSTTPTVYIPVETKTATEKVTEKTAKKTKASEEEEEDDSQEEASQTIKCVSAVYLHPEPNSSSANLLTIPAGAEVKFFRNENGWYYVDYNGTQGYAYGTFFSQPS